MRLSFIISIILLSSVAASAQQAPLTDLVVKGFDRPLRIRLVVNCAGLAWREHGAAQRGRRVQALFDQLDIDDDGGLIHAEAKRLPSPQALGRPRNDNDVYVAFNFRVLDGNGDGRATLDEVAEYVAGFTNPPIRMQQIVPTASAASINLYSLLDANDDGRLEAGEWNNVGVLLDRDRDGNRVLSNQEMQRDLAGLFGPEFVAVPLARGLANRPLDFELADSTGAAADAVVTVRFSDMKAPSDREQEPQVELKVGETAAKRGLRGSVSRDGAAVLSMQRQRIELRLVPPAFRRTAQLRQSLLREFEAGAARSGGAAVLGAALPDHLGPVLSVADSNGDGKVDAGEFETCLYGYVTASLAADASQLRLSILPQRSGLMSVVDANLDGRLSLRELSGLPAAVSACAGDGETIDRDDVPTTISLVLQRGPFDAEPGMQMLLSSGPPWFFRADRNRDGDLDRKEFLGTAEVFERLDANGDGWIELQEAIRGDTMFRD